MLLFRGRDPHALEARAEPCVDVEVIAICVDVKEGA